MSGGLWLYAFVDDVVLVGHDLGLGLAGEPLRLVAPAGLRAVVGALPGAPPAPTPAALREHDAAVRRLEGLAGAVLPARFGQVAADEAALAERIGPRVDALRRALDLVRGREQMTLRLFGPLEATGALPAADDPGDTGLGPGARYLARRRAALGVPEAAGLLEALGARVRATRVERPAAGAGELLASVYHLVDRGAADGYRAQVEALAPGLAPRRVRVSGPWPAYAFAGEAP
ncbi:MAG: GvpL/GvpF family gas vesicle protein [Planctomycetes bacterium]|nr:GvpL/GvpF family gas vesicle protein [Planctomycetota bacterium]